MYRKMGIKLTTKYSPNFGLPKRLKKRINLNLKIIKKAAKHDNQAEQQFVELLIKKEKIWTLSNIINNKIKI